MSDAWDSSLVFVVDWRVKEWWVPVLRPTDPTRFLTRVQSGFGPGVVLKTRCNISVH